MYLKMYGVINTTTTNEKIQPKWKRLFKFWRKTVGTERDKLGMNSWAMVKTVARDRHK